MSFHFAEYQQEHARIREKLEEDDNGSETASRS